MKTPTNDTLRSYLTELGKECHIDSDGDLYILAQAEDFAYPIHIYFYITEEGWLVVDGLAPDCNIPDDQVGMAILTLNAYRRQCIYGPKGMLAMGLIHFLRSYYICDEMPEEYFRKIALQRAIEEVSVSLSAVHEVFWNYIGAPQEQAGQPDATH